MVKCCNICYLCVELIYWALYLRKLISDAKRRTGVCRCCHHFRFIRLRFYGVSVKIPENGIYISRILKTFWLVETDLNKLILMCDFKRISSLTETHQLRNWVVSSTSAEHWQTLAHICDWSAAAEEQTGWFHSVLHYHQQQGLQK